jgi:hypothetical protein
MRDAKQAEDRLAVARHGVEIAHRIRHWPTRAARPPPQVLPANMGQGSRSEAVQPGSVTLGKAGMTLGFALLRDFRIR